jgi:ABC-2 type transport system permease protein
VKGRVATIVGKEFLEIRRSKLYIALSIVVPGTLMMIFGYGMSLDVKDIAVAVWDLNRTLESREYVASFLNSGYFRLGFYARGQDEMEEALRRGRIRGALVIPADFSSKLEAGKAAQVQLLIDGSFPNQASTVKGYMEAINAQFNENLVRYLAPELNPIRIESRVWFNPELASKNFIVPGVIVTILLFYPALLATLAVVREKEQGSILNILSSPIRPWEYIVGKMIPYLIISLFVFFFLFLLALWSFRIPFRGSFPLLLVASVFYLLGTVGIGLVISVLLRTQVGAMLLTSIVTIIPAFFYSGFFVPIPSMGKVSQVESYLFPSRYYMRIVRDSFLKGIGWDRLWPDILALAIYALILLSASILLFRKKVG